MSKIKALFLTANPSDTKPLKLDEQHRLITKKIRASDYRDAIEFISAWAVRPDDLLQSLNMHHPHIVHFSGHGTQSEEILTVGNDGKSKPISKEAIKALFSTLKDNIRIVILDACYTRPQAEAVIEEIDCAIGMNTAIGEKAATIFTASFYSAIGFGRSVKEAFNQGKVALLLEGIPESNTPELLCKPGIEPGNIFILKASVDSPDANIASRIITFLEGRRVLYGPVHKNCPGGIIQTIAPIRQKIASELEPLDRKSHLYDILSNMRNATLEFLNYVCKDCETPETCDQCTIEQGGCADGLIEYRKKIGQRIAVLAHSYNIDVEGELSSILPTGNISQTYGDERKKMVA